MCVCVYVCVFQLVCQCCEDDGKDPSSALDELIGRMREGQLGQTTFLRLLTEIQKEVPSSFPPELCSLLEEVRQSKQEVPEPQEPGR